MDVRSLFPRRRSTRFQCGKSSSSKFCSEEVVVLSIFFCGPFPRWILGLSPPVLRSDEKLLLLLEHTGLVCIGSQNMRRKSTIGAVCANWFSLSGREKRYVRRQGRQVHIQVSQCRAIVGSRSKDLVKMTDLSPAWGRRRQFLHRLWAMSPARSAAVVSAYVPRWTSPYRLGDLALIRSS